MGKPILCLDFDGVIHSYSSGWKGADVIPDPPVEGAIAFMLGALNHFDVAIFSSRSNQPGGLTAMQRWLRDHAGASWHESPAGPGLEDIRFVTEKPPAMVTIDDRALTFDGTWPAVETLKAFQPWNKRAALKTTIRNRTMECPASMCPLIAPNGSPWTGEYGGPCPGHDDLDSGGCPWWSMACATGGIQHLVEEAAECGGRSSMPIAGPNQPRRHTIGDAKSYDCPKASVCRWQEQAKLAGRELCPPRDALARGIDPRVCLF